MDYFISGMNELLKPKGDRELFRYLSHAEKLRAITNEEDGVQWRRRSNFVEENERDKELKHHKLVLPSFMRDDYARKWIKECEEVNCEEAPIYDGNDEAKGTPIFDDVPSIEWQAAIIEGQLVFNREGEVIKAQVTRETQWQAGAYQKFKPRKPCSATITNNDGTTLNYGTPIYDEEPQQEGTNPLYNDYVEHEEAPYYENPPTYDEPPQYEGTPVLDEFEKTRGLVICEIPQLIEGLKNDTKRRRKLT